MITKTTNSDEEGVKLFFQYCDEYFARQADVLYEQQLHEQEISFCFDQSCTKHKNTIFQIITYDASKKSVFSRYLDQNRQQISTEELHSSYQEALETIKT